MSRFPLADLAQPENTPDDSAPPPIPPRPTAKELLASGIRTSSACADEKGRRLQFGSVPAGQQGRIWAIEHVAPGAFVPPVAERTGEVSGGWSGPDEPGGVDGLGMIGGEKPSVPVVVKLPARDRSRGTASATAAAVAGAAGTATAGRVGPVAAPRSTQPLPTAQTVRAAAGGPAASTTNERINVSSVDSASLVPTPAESAPVEPLADNFSNNTKDMNKIKNDSTNQTITTSYTNKSTQLDSTSISVLPRISGNTSINSTSHSITSPSKTNDEAPITTQPVPGITVSSSPGLAHPHRNPGYRSAPAAPPIYRNTDNPSRRAHHAPHPLWLSDKELAGEKAGLLRRWGIGTGAGKGDTAGIASTTRGLLSADAGMNGRASPSGPSRNTSLSASRSSSQSGGPFVGPSSPASRSPLLSPADPIPRVSSPSPSASSEPTPTAIPAPPSPLADRIAAYVHDFYASLDVRSARPGPGQWTVLAAYLAVRREKIPPDVPQAKSGTLSSTPPLASIDQPGTSIRILSLATGVKCIGGTVPNRPDVLVDMHAEILARREVELLLAEEVWEMRQAEGVFRSEHLLDVGWQWENQAGAKRKNRKTPKPESVTGIRSGAVPRRVVPGSEAAIAAKSATATATPTPSAPAKPTSGRFRLRGDTEIWLYTSHAPCGSASNAAHLARMDREDEVLRACLQEMGVTINEEQVSRPLPASVDAKAVSLAGATPTPPPIVVSQSSGDQISQPSQLTSPPPTTPMTSTSTFRSSRLTAQPPLDKKPSRPDARATTAYSCSDKLSRYQALGYQGGRLSRAIEPIRLRGVVIGEEFDEEGMRKLVGGGTGWSRMQDGMTEVVEGQSDPDGLAWLRGIPRNVDILHSSVEYSFGRAAVMRKIGSDISPVKPENIAELSPGILALPFPILRDHIIPRAPIQPFSIASSWHAGAHIEVITPVGRDSRVPRIKKIEDETEGGWLAASRTRISRHRMWDTWEQLRIAREPGPSIRQDGKGSAGWRAASAWMEERGPFKGWHENVNRPGLEGRGMAARSDETDSVGSMADYDNICHE